MDDVTWMMEFRDEHWDYWVEFVKDNEDYCDNTSNHKEYCDCKNCKGDKYLVKIPVESTIEISLRANNEETAKKMAIKKAIEDHPKVDWIVDGEIEIEVNKDED